MAVTKTIETPIFKIGFSNLHTAKSFSKEDPKYGFEMVFSGANAEKFKNEVATFAKDCNLTPGYFKSPVKDGNLPTASGYPKGVKCPIYMDATYAAAKSSKMFAVVKYNRETGQVEYVPKEQAHEFNMGTYCRAMITLSFYDTPIGGKGITIYANGIEKLLDSEENIVNIFEQMDHSKVEDEIQKIRAAKESIEKMMS